MWPSTYFGIPALPLATIGTLLPWDAKPRTVRNRSEEPVPQFAPKASGVFAISSTILTISALVMPIMVRPAVSKLMVPTKSIPAKAKPSAAARYSSGAEMVSTHATSAPPAFKPSAVSWNISTARACVSSPTGCMISPVGPTEPATMTLRPA